jgi:nitric oxide reductase subunit B
MTLLGGTGAILFFFGKFDFLGWRGEGTPAHFHDGALAGWKLTPSQWATGKFFVVVAALFMLQGLAGGALAHYRVEPGAFYGIDLASLSPYNLLRTWHLQLAIFWVATAWVGGGLFLAPLVERSEPASPENGWASMTGSANSGSGWVTRARSISTWDASGSFCSPWVWSFGLS